MAQSSLLTSSFSSFQDTSSSVNEQNKHQRKISSQRVSIANPKPRSLEPQFEANILEPLAQTIESAIVQGKYQCSPFQLSSPAFVSISVPQISILKYLRRLATYVPCSKECFIIATVLLGRLEANRNCPIFSIQTAHALIFTSLVVAHKVHDDVNMRNKNIAPIGGFDVFQINEMESEFLRMINFQTHVSQEQYERYSFLLSSMISPTQQITSQTQTQTQFEPMKYSTQ